MSFLPLFKLFPSVQVEPFQVSDTSVLVEGGMNPPNIRADVLEAPAPPPPDLPVVSVPGDTVHEVPSYNSVSNVRKSEALAPVALTALVCVPTDEVPPDAP